MNRAARRHLLARLDAASRPIRIVHTEQIPDDAARSFIFEAITRGQGSLVLPLASRFEILHPRPAVRVVAGKGTRRRGIHGRIPPLRLLYLAEPVASRRARLRAWKALAIASLSRRFATHDRMRLLEVQEEAGGRRVQIVP